MNDQIRVNGVLYRQQFRKCGKASCKCAETGGHGPYWYAYDGTGTGKYIGSKLPEQVLAFAALLKLHAKEIKKIRRQLEIDRDNTYKRYLRTGQQLQALSALEAGERVGPGVLIDVGLSQFNWKKI